MRSILKSFPTEEVILHKPSGQTYEVTALVSSSSIQSEDISIPIEVNDYFERKLPSGITEYYQVIDAGFHKGMHGIPDHYQTKVKTIKEPIQYRVDDKDRQKMIFISHSSMDKEITKAFVDLLFEIGLNEDDIVCSSYPGLGVPLRESIYEWLVEKFQEYDLHVLYFLSHNYYKSAASLNEMGAAWAMKQKWDSVLLPGFSFSDISGCIDPTRIGIKLDGDLAELKHRLGELKDDIISEFGLRTVSATRWERIRDSFISKIREPACNDEKRKETERESLHNERRPELRISYGNDIVEDGEIINDIKIENGIIKFSVEPISVVDAQNGILYKDEFGIEHKASLTEVRNYRYLCKNGFSILWHIENYGNAKATGVRVKFKFPDELLVLSVHELMEIIREEPIRLSEDAYEGWSLRFFEPEYDIPGEKVFLSKDELTTTEAIAELLDPAENEGNETESYDILPGRIEYKKKEIQHLDRAWFRGVYILPTAPGRYEIKCSILCNEYAEPTEQSIIIEIE